MSDQTPMNDELVSRLRVIEAQPLASRASAYSILHDELTRTLESGASTPDVNPR